MAFLRDAVPSTKHLTWILLMAFIAMVINVQNIFSLGKNDEDPISKNEAPNFDDDPYMAADSSDSQSSKSNDGFELRRTGACKVLTSIFFYWT